MQKSDSHDIKEFKDVRLANKKGFYFHIKFEGAGKTVEEIEKAENIDGMILRYLTVKVKKHDLKTNYFEKKEFQAIPKILLLYLHHHF